MSLPCKLLLYDDYSCSSEALYQCYFLVEHKEQLRFVLVEHKEQFVVNPDNVLIMRTVIMKAISSFSLN